MNNILSKQSHKFGLGWGVFKLLIQHTGAYIQMLILGFSSISAFYVLNQWALETFGESIPFQLFVLSIFLLIAFLCFFEWKLGLPSTFIAWNNQWWEHRNPLKKEVAEMRKQLSEMKKLLEKINDKG